MKEIKRKIRTFIGAAIKGHELQDDDDIFSSGFINSLFAVQLVLFVEEEFQITIENEDLELENFRSVNAITQLVMRKSEMTESTVPASVEVSL